MLEGRGGEMKTCTRCARPVVFPDYSEGDNHYHDGCYVEHLIDVISRLNDVISRLKKELK